MQPGDILSIGDVAARTGASVSAIRFYEDKGLITPARTEGKQRRYLRSDIRRLSFILIAQRLGFTLAEIREQLDSLPDGKTPTRADWMRISRQFRRELDQRITLMTRMRDSLDGCIGCGCLSLRSCKQENPGDIAEEAGPGARYILDGPPAAKTRRRRGLFG